MHNNLPFISVVIPSYNEEKFIGRCLDSILGNNYPKEKMEILVVDGMSTDKTRKILEEYSKKYPFIKILDNPRKLCPIGLNVGIKQSTGKIIVRLDAHNVYDREYIIKSVKYLQKYKADNVGGIWKMVPRTNDFLGKAITLVMASPFGAGNAQYKTTSSDQKPRWVETVPYGCFKRELFDKIGYFCEEIDFSEDIEFNSRIKKAGGKILLAPDIISYYNTRTNFKDFVRHTLRNGIWITYPLKSGRVLFSWRHLIPLVFVLSLMFTAIFGFFYQFTWIVLALILSLYMLANLYFSFKISVREKKFKYLITLPFLFAFFHIMYGLGSVWGIFKV